MPATRHLVFILGDQLDEHSAALTDFDPQRDQIFMAEVVEESTHVWSSKTRTAFFFAAMRHFAEAQQQRGFPVDYARIGTHDFATLCDALTAAIKRFQPTKIIMIEPGDWRIEQALLALGKQLKVPFAIREDQHFLISRHEFSDWAKS